MSNIIETLEKIRANFYESMQKSLESAELEEMRVRFLGKKSEILEVLKSLKDLDIEERKVVGAKANELRESFESEIRKTIESLKNKDIGAILQKPSALSVTITPTSSMCASNSKLVKIRVTVVRIR